MVAFLERFGIFARSPDPRPLAEIAADIDDELAFHLDASKRALEAEGLAPEPARAEALRRFGDYGRIRRECARTWMGERIMLQRIQLALTATLVVVVGFMLWSSRESSAALAAERAQSTELLARLEAAIRSSTSAAPEDDAPRESYRGVTPPKGEYHASDHRETTLEWAATSWREEFELQPKVWRHGLEVAERLAALPDAQGAEILERIWPDLSVEHREQALKPFVFEDGHPYAVEVLELGFEDAAASVRERASLYVQTYSWQDLRAGEGRATAWFAAWRDRPVAEVLRENARRWAGDLATIRAEYEPAFQRQAALDLLVVLDEVRPAAFENAHVDLGAVLREAGLGEIADAEVARVSDAAARARIEKLRSLGKRNYGPGAK